MSHNGMASIKFIYYYFSFSRGFLVKSALLDVNNYALLKF